MQKFTSISLHMNFMWTSHETSDEFVGNFSDMNFAWGTICCIQKLFSENESDTKYNSLLLRGPSLLNENWAVISWMYLVEALTYLTCTWLWRNSQSTVAWQSSFCRHYSAQAPVKWWKKTSLPNKTKDKVCIYL